jgi:glycerol-3-phosphate acyltransferase PlsY
MIAVPILIAIAAFLIGSIPFGYIIGRLFYHTDIRSQGSGNIGAMNALRTLGKGGAIAVLLLDALKGFVPTIVTLWLFRHRFDFDIEGLPQGDQLLGSLVAMAAVLGHCFSPWLRFKGGKGVATFFGTIFALCWPAGLIAIGGWIAGALLTKYSSVGSLLGSIAAPIAIWSFTASPVETLYGVCAALLIVFTHRKNIARLRAGTEGAIRL